MFSWWRLYSKASLRSLVSSRAAGQSMGCILDITDVEQGLSEQLQLPSPLCGGESIAEVTVAGGPKAWVAHGVHNRLGLLETLLQKRSRHGATQVVLVPGVLKVFVVDLFKDARRLDLRQYFKGPQFF